MGRLLCEGAPIRSAGSGRLPCESTNNPQRRARGKLFRDGSLRSALFPQKPSPGPTLLTLCQV